MKWDTASARCWDRGLPGSATPDPVAQMIDTRTQLAETEQSKHQFVEYKNKAYIPVIGTWSLGELSGIARGLL